MSTIDLPRSNPPVSASCPCHDSDSNLAQHAGLSAKAYCGPAHGHAWSLEDPASCPDRVVLTCGSGQHDYQLVRDPRARRPARDHLGSVVYMPLR